MRSFHGLYLLLILVYAQGVFAWFDISDTWSKFSVELAIIFLFVMSVIGTKDGKVRAAPGLILALLFVIWTIFSGVDAADGFYISLLYFRMTAYAYVVFWCVWNASLTIREVLCINRLILGLWLGQIVVSLFYVLASGERKETLVGTITSVGGGPATAFPVFVLAYIMAFYFYYKRSSWIVLLAFSFGIVGYASGKRAIYFIIPLFLVVVILWHWIRERSFVSAWVSAKPVALFVLFIPVLVLGLTNSKRFEHLEGLGFFETVAVAIDVADEYDNRIVGGGVTTGRSATSMKVLENLVEDPFGLYLLGEGPASLMKVGDQRALESMGIAYGVVGWARDVISIGWPGMLFHVGFYTVIWVKLYRRRDLVSNKYAKALQFGCHLGFLAYFILYFFYLDAFAMAGWLTFVQLYFAAIIISPKHQNLLQA